MKKLFIIIVLLVIIYLLFFSSYGFQKGKDGRGGFLESKKEKTLPESEFFEEEPGFLQVHL